MNRLFIGVHIAHENVIMCESFASVAYMAKKKGIKYKDRMFKFSVIMYGWARVKDNKLYDKLPFCGEISGELANLLFYKNDIRRLRAEFDSTNRFDN